MHSQIKIPRYYWRCSIYDPKLLGSLTENSANDLTNYILKISVTQTRGFGVLGSNT